MEKVIVAVSDNTQGHPAIAWALDFAAARHATVELVHVVDSTWDNAPPEFLGMALRGAEDFLREEAASAERVRSDVVVSHRVLAGSPTAELVAYARDADLLVIGSHPGSSHRHAGRRAVRIAALAPCTVVVVPSDTLPGKGVVVGTDGSSQSRRAVDFAAEQADRLGETLTVIHSWVSQEPWAFVEPILLPVDPTAEDRLVLGDAVEGLAERYPGLHVLTEAAGTGAAGALIAWGATARMIVVGNRRRRGITKLLLGSVSEEVVFELPTVIAVVRSARKTRPRSAAPAKRTV